MQTGLHNDYGCALHSRGCFHALIFAPIERDLLAAVLRKRNVRFGTSFEKLAPMKIKELYHAIRRDESAPYFEFSVLQVPVLLRSLKGDQGSWGVIDKSRCCAGLLRREMLGGRLSEEHDAPLLHEGFDGYAADKASRQKSCGASCLAQG